ncbi:MAG: LysR family transcriptional regulator [Ktedonobacterales bacterium]
MGRGEMAIPPAQYSVTLYQLRTFVTVARHRNYTHAAEDLYLSQPSVSAQVHDLERAIGLPLFDQIGKRLVLTQAGQLLAEHAQTILGAVDTALAALGRLHRVETGRLTVGASTTVGAYLLPAVLGAFRARYPGVEITLALQNSEAVCDDVRRGTFELGVIESQADAVGEDLHLTPYREDELVLIVPPWHPWSGLGDVPIAALQDATLLWREPGSGTRSVGEAALRAAHVQPHVAMQIGGTDAIKQAVAANLGVALVSHTTVSAEVASGRLVSLHVTGADLRRTFFVVQRRGALPSPVMDAFLRLLLGQPEPDDGHTAG